MKREHVLESLHCCGAGACACACYEKDGVWRTCVMGEIRGAIDEHSWDSLQKSRDILCQAPQIDRG